MFLSRRVLDRRRVSFSTLYSCNRSFHNTSIVYSSEESVEDSFHVLQVPRQFKISPSELKQKYHKLMTEYHPDKHTGKSSAERDRMDELASRVTHAFQTLTLPHTRATHLLDLLGSLVRHKCGTRTKKNERQTINNRFSL